MNSRKIPIRQIIFQIKVYAVIVKPENFQAKKYRCEHNNKNAILINLK